MKKFLLVMFVLAALFMVGCGNGDSGLVGTWERGDETLVFSRDGTGSDNFPGGSSAFTWESDSNGNLIIRDGDGMTRYEWYEIIGTTLSTSRWGRDWRRR